MSAPFGNARPERRRRAGAYDYSSEQAANDPIDGRSDLYALGVVGFLALSGRLPFHAASVPALFAKQLPLGLALLPVVPTAIFHLRQTYRALHAGYSLADLQYALTRWRSEREEELAFELDAKLPLALRTLRQVTYASIPAFAVWVGACIATGIFGPGVHEVPHWAGTITGTLFFAIPATFIASTTLGVPLLPKRLSSAISLGALRTRFWNSRFGAWTAKALGGKRRGTPDQLVDRPTEMALGIAASELFAALPKSYREQLHELPTVVRKLEARATTLRKRIEETEAIVARARDERPASTLLAGTGPTAPDPSTGSLAGATPSAAARRDSAIEQLVASHDHLKRDLSLTVARLESIRLDLLRVHGGAHDLEPLTTLLDAAGHVERELGP